MISQRELAKRLNVSQPTISKALRAAPDIHPDTRDRILQEMQKLGMTSRVKAKPAAVAEKAREGATRFLGVLCANRPGATGYDNALYMDGLSEEARARGISLVVDQFSGPGRELLDEAAWSSALSGGLIDGLVLVYQFDPEVVSLLSRRFPLVTITHWVPEAACDHVDSDHITGMQRLVRHLVGLGHRKIGFMMHSGDTGFERSRYASVVRAALEERLAVPPVLWVGRGDTGETYDAAAERVVESMKEGVTAWMGDSDKSMAAVAQLLEQRGVAVPGQVSLTGFDQIRHMLPMQRRLTTVQTPRQRMGREAIRMLLRRMEDPGGPPLKLLVDTPLVVGDTTGPAPER